MPSKKPNKTKDQRAADPASPTAPAFPAPADLLDALPDPTLAVDSHGRVMAWNRAMEDLTGVPAKDLLGKANHEHGRAFYGERRPMLVDLALEDDPETARLYDFVRQEGEAVVAEVFAPRIRGGAYLWGRAVPLKDSAGAVIGAIETVRDITVQRNIELALRENEHRFRALFDSATDANFVIEDGVFVQANARALEMFRADRDQLVGARPEAVSPEQQADGMPSLELARRYLAAAVKGERQLFEWTHKRIDGTCFEGEVTLSRVDLVGSEAILATVRDISERKAAERDRGLLQEQLRRAEKMEAIGQLAGGIAHDFNNLLQVIAGYAEMAVLDLDSPDQVQEHLEEVRRAASRARDLTRQLLTFGRREAFQPSLLDIKTLVSNLLKLIRRLIGEDIELLLRTPEGALPTVFADPGQIEQVIVNLCINARDAMRRGGRITIELEEHLVDDAIARLHPEIEPGAYLGLTVTDTGEGIPEEHRERVFEPFFTTKDVGHGTGLGLATVYGIVRRHNGMIDFESRMGQGTSFRVLLPEADSRNLGSPAETHPGETAHGGTETILVAEDDDLVRNLAAQILRKAGYKLLLASDGAQAIELVERRHRDIDLALLDVVLPKRSGREVYEALQANAPQVPVLFSSGYTYTVLESSRLPRGSRLIRKPYSPRDLLATIRQTLEPRPRS